MGRSASEADSGSATVWVLGFGALIVTVALLAVIDGSAVLARHRVERAADLAAIAAAQRIGRNPDLCGAARRVAAENQTVLVGCQPELAASGRAGTVRIVVRRQVSLPILGNRTVDGRARAGRLGASGTPDPAAGGGGAGSDTSR